MSDHEKLREAIREVREWNRARGVTTAGMALILDAAESTLPKTKMMEVWHVESVGCAAGNKGALFVAVYPSREEAANSTRYKGDHFACIRVTGPHQQEVPA